MRQSMKSVVSTSISAILLVSNIVGCGSPPSGSDEAAATEEAISVSSLSDVQLFDGIMLGDGPGAGLFPEMWGSFNPRAIVTAPSTTVSLAGKWKSLAATLRAKNMPQLAATLEAQANQLASTNHSFPAMSNAEVDAQIQRLHKQLLASNPTFFKNFAQDMRSGSHVRVQNALQSVRSAVTKKSGNTAAAGPTPDMQCETCDDRGGGGGGGGGGGTADTWLAVQNVVALQFGAVVQAGVFVETGVFIAVAFFLVAPILPPQSSSGLAHDEFVDRLTTRMPALK